MYTLQVMIQTLHVGVPGDKKGPIILIRHYIAVSARTVQVRVFGLLFLHN